MAKKRTRAYARKKRHKRIRRTLIGTSERPRLNVFRSLNEIYAQLICSPAIFSASSKDLSKSFLNDSISSIFHFLIEEESDSHTQSTTKLSSSSFKKLQTIVLILLLHISIEVIILSKFIL